MAAIERLGRELSKSEGDVEEEEDGDTACEYQCCGDRRGHWL